MDHFGSAAFFFYKVAGSIIDIFSNIFSISFFKGLRRTHAQNVTLPKTLAKTPLDYVHMG